MSDSKKILVVDDSKEFTFLISSLLKFHQIDVTDESNPEVALEIAKKEKFAVMITDYMMDEMNGIELSEAVRNDSINKDIKIMLLTSKDLDEDELAKLNSLELSYVKKPIMPNDIYKKVMELLDKSSNE
jgi:CheY-like chemotaxis protein